MWWEVIVDALIDTAYLLPLLLIVHVLIEVFEHFAASKIRFSRALKGPLAPLIGTGVGVIPQCGFSVVAADLYSKKSIGIGALLAVFIATSDEAVPIMLSQPDSVVKMLILIGIKTVFALIVGYAAHFIFKRKEYPVPETADAAARPEIGCHGHEIGEADHEGAEALELEHCGHEIGETHDDAEEPEIGCHGHKIGKTHEDEKFGWREWLLHPLLHTLTIGGYVLAVNLAFGFFVFFIGEAALTDFLSMTAVFQPILAALIGLIPNCAASVLITQLYTVGGLGLGAAVAGLSVNAGLGFAVLFKQNKNAKENALILVAVLALSIILGMAITLLDKYVFFLGL